MKSKLVAVTLALLFSWQINSVSAQERWIKIDESKDGSHLVYALRGSYGLSRNKGGDQIAVITTRSVNKKSDRVFLQKSYVRTRDCAAKQGKIVSLSMDGEFLYENDFIFDAGTIATSIAEMICLIYAADQAERDGKGI